MALGAFVKLWRQDGLEWYGQFIGTGLVMPPGNGGTRVWEMAGLAELARQYGTIAGSARNAARDSHCVPALSDFRSQ